MSKLNFLIDGTDNRAKAGRIEINNKVIHTPVFMPVATRGAIKGIDNNMLKQINHDILLSNTYHLYLRPGIEIIKKSGGLHNFMNWDNLILTDSGGFQGWSLKGKQYDDGIEFKSVYDGHKFLLTPELSISIQNEIGSDIAMVLDSLIDYDSSPTELENAINKTTEWSEIAKKVHNNNQQALFGIIQGGLNNDLRIKSIQQIMDIGFDGYAIGGLSVGETRLDRIKIVDLCTSNLDLDKPIYVMGLGDVAGMIELIELGVDMFDCVWPTRLARHGKVISGIGYINIKNNRYKSDNEALVKNCDCLTCLSYSRAYINHLIRTEEVTAWPYLIYHNLYETKKIINEAREAILTKDFDNFKRTLKSGYEDITTEG